MPFLLAEILNFQGSTHRIGVGSFSQFIIIAVCQKTVFVLRLCMNWDILFWDIDLKK